MAELRHAFLACEEFRNSIQAFAQQPIGMFKHVDAIDVETSCTPDQLAHMVARIAHEWRTFGETEPHWSVLTGNEFRSENIAGTIDAFYASGHADIDWLLNGIGRSGLQMNGFHNALDFGCGVGRLVLALAARADRVVGIDISPPHLKLARERAGQASIDNVEFRAIETIGDLASCRGFDLVTSYLVIQHNPPPVMAAIVEQLLRTLASGGIAVLQLPTYLAHAAHFSSSKYLANTQPSMEMNALSQPRMFEIIEQCECRVLEIIEDGVLGAMPGISQTFTIRKK